MSDSEDATCPLCMEEMDLIDRNFVPCPCGYRVCNPNYINFILLMIFINRYVCGVGIISERI